MSIDHAISEELNIEEVNKISAESRLPPLMSDSNGSVNSKVLDGENMINGDITTSDNLNINGNVNDNIEDAVVEEVAADLGKQNGNVEGEQNEEVWEDLLSSGAIMKLIVKQGKPDTRPIRTQTCVIDVDCCLLDGTVVEKKVDSEIVLGECEVCTSISLHL